jgi:integrase
VGRAPFAVVRPGTRGRAARKLADKIHSELVAGTFNAPSRKTWEEFQTRYDEVVLAGKARRTRLAALTSFAIFAKLAAPAKVSAINSETIADFVCERRKLRGQKRGAHISPASVNHDLRHIKAALGFAVEWGYLERVPKFHMEKEPEKLPVYVTPEHFAAIYGACSKARFPEGIAGVDPADWWRGLIVTAYMTGWRISELLALTHADLNIEAGVAITRHEDNKGKRDERVKLHPVVVEHLKKVRTLGGKVLRWPHDEKTLRVQFAELQEEAGIHLPCRGQHEHTRWCHVYGFHALRRAFATMNADRLTSDALQVLMRHKSYQTTKRYINMARQIDGAVDGLHVPEVLKGKKAAGA